MPRHKTAACLGAPQAPSHITSPKQTKPGEMNTPREGNGFITNYCKGVKTQLLALSFCLSKKRQCWDSWCVPNPYHAILQRLAHEANGAKRA